MTEKGNNLVLIVGCGELGSRHLQAVATLPQVDAVEVVDPRPESLALGRQRLAEVSERSRSTTFRWLSSLDQATSGGDLCIVATRAEGRCQLVRDVVQGLDYSTFILEKLVGQSVQEMEALIDFSAATALSAWVNCKMRAYPFHRKLKELIGTTDAVNLNVVGGNWGLATNGIHLADTFAFYDESPSIESAGAHIDPTLHSSKRGDGLYDLSGSLQGYTEKGSRFTLSYAPNSEDPGHMSIATRRFRCIIDHGQRWAFRSDSESGWAWRKVPFEDRILVSEMTRVFAADILATGRCALPTLEESMVAHRFILGELQPHFSRLMEKDVDLCPVT